MKCAACGSGAFGPMQIRDLCQQCAWDRLPFQTRRAYDSMLITTRQAVDCLRTRTASVKTFGGGKLK